MNVDFPTPGAPEIPIRSAPPVADMTLDNKAAASRRCTAFVDSTKVIPLASARRCPARICCAKACIALSTTACSLFQAALPSCRQARHLTGLQGLIDEAQNLGGRNGNVCARAKNGGNASRCQHVIVFWRNHTTTDHQNLAGAGSLQSRY